MKIQKQKRADDQPYHQMVSDAITRVRQGRHQALRAVNQEQIRLNWDLGKLIVERQAQHGWGKSVVEKLAADLQRELGAESDGFSSRNLWRARNFYAQYQLFINLPQPVAEIGWSHNVVILEKCKDPDERLFYVHKTRDLAWTKAVLIHQIENQTYQKTLLGQHNFEQTVPPDLQRQAILALRDEYTFDFLELGDLHTEQELERSILNNIRKFLIKMGGDFCYIGNQYKLEVEGRSWSVDLLLFHRGLEALVAIELKVTEFLPEYAGKMNFYLGLLNAKVRKPHEKPSIGIIICKSKERTTEEYALQDMSKPIGVATYGITQQLPRELQQFFPNRDEFIRRVEAVKG